MKAFSLVILGGIILGTTGSHAIDVSYLASDWNAKIEQCPGESYSLDTGCIDGCNGNTREITGLFAHEINERGAKFCVSRVDSYRKKTTVQPYTTYYGSASACVWLCKDGWGGTNCNVSVSLLNSCSPNVLTQATHSKIRANNTNADSLISFFDTQKYKCADKQFAAKASTYKQEHDLILGIVGYTTSGHGAFVQPLTVRAWCAKNKKGNDCRTIVHLTGSSQLLCKPGYKHNSTKTDCVAVSEIVCAQTKFRDCEGWDRKRFNTDTYIAIDKGACLQYRCAEAGYGFAGDPEINNFCIKCENTSSQNANLQESNGQCVFSDKSKKTTVSDDGKIIEEDLQPVTKSDMIKIVGGWPCWTRSSPQEYKACILEQE